MPPHPHVATLRRFGTFSPQERGEGKRARHWFSHTSARSPGPRLWSRPHSSSPSPTLWVEHDAVPPQQRLADRPVRAAASRTRAIRRLRSAASISRTWRVVELVEFARRRARTVFTGLRVARQELRVDRARVVDMNGCVESIATSWLPAFMRQIRRGVGLLVLHPRRRSGAIGRPGRCRPAYRASRDCDSTA